ncbi:MULTISPECIES: cytidine deaminase [Bacteroidota]|mgnify:FL=1|jgi:cytidine deaminase|uniref:Cytidine deaminase n=3 Tax=Flectobacillus TaxID=101 RepID=A0ABT6Z3X3_9BACT|nr:MULTISPECIES: cytidine deaminase [Bacteroidota]NBA76204.1 cytidine deaminase [Emticicia sp. ODNR4P]MDI9861370.1 cytidine deaminase [Flectobacillus roseus]MDI9866726.1 cytidine deaminase [Flectobacillus longus]MDI9870948.1 cytidine deaminase [Flectobacillus roseus]MDI9875349.1 cytidine deaminase [Flectobacillus rivi]
MQKLNVTISLESYDSETELSAKEQLLLMEARKATYKSYAPYSQFHVGAAILLEDDTIITANNQENAAFPSGSCAEQSAIFWVGANHPDKKIKSIAVIARPGKGDEFRGVPPCGACRQAMLEYEVRQKQPIRLLMLGANNQVLATESIGDLLPLKFEEF